MTPPLPPGFTMDGPPPPRLRTPGTLSAPPRRDPNLIKPLLDLGAEPTNGFRTPADIQRLKAEGYTAATNSGHLAGDDVDLTPGKSGLSLQQLRDRAAQIAARWPNGSAAIHNGTHVHLALPGWGMAPGTPGTPNFGLPAMPPGFKIEQRGSLAKGNYMPGSLGPPQSPQQPTGAAHDGDTVDLANGQHGRLFGFDAFELAQKGHNASGQVVPLGTQARDYMLSRIRPGSLAYPVGAQSYGRPVVNLSQDPMADPAHDALRLGYGVAAPYFLKGSPQFTPYMEAERLARMNQLGGFQTDASTPAQFRHGEPFLKPQPGVSGQEGSMAVFKDEPMPFQGYRPEVEKALVSIWQDPKATPDQYIKTGQQFGLTFDPKTVEAKFASRFDAKGNPKSGVLGDKLPDPVRQPRPLTDPGDKAFGSFARGLGDPFNALDELGSVPDTLGLTPGRENLFNAPAGTRFGDILANNLEQNRSIIAHDEFAHPYARTAGQLTSGVALPMGAATTPVRLGALMAAEGGLAGFMAGEGNIRSRLPGTALGATIGAVAGPVLGLAGEHLVSPIFRKAISLLPGRRVARDVAAEAVSVPPLPEGFALEQPAEVVRGGTAPTRPPGALGSAAMRDENATPDLVGPIVGDPASGAHTPSEGLGEPAPFGVTRNVNQRLSAEEMAKLAEGVDPASVVPRPASEVGSLEEATKANPGRFQQIEAPHENEALGVRTLTTASGGKVRVRGPLDITQSLRLMGGVKDDGGDLASLGIDNAPRRMPFGSNEQFLGKLVNNESGMSLDDATLALWEEGYFPEFRERPTPDDLISKLHDESTGAQRYFHPDDFEEVSDFHAARQDASRIDAAEQRGSPLVDDRGQSINLDDLVSNTPPVTAYEDTPRLTGKIGNINLDRLEKPGDVAQLVDQVSKRVGGFDAAARGKVTQEETRRLADELGVKPEQLLKRQQGQALNAEQLYASRALVQRSRETVVRLAKKAVGGSDDDVATFRKAWLRHVALEEQIAGATSEAGRALQQFNMLARAQDAGGDAVRSYLKGGGGRDTIEDAAQAIVDLSEDPAKANHFMREAVKPTWRDKFNELWINSLLSGPRTHMVNFVGNALTTAMSFPELATTAAIGKVTRSADRALFGEVGARAHGLVDSSLDALKAAKVAFRTGEPLDHSAKVEALQHQAIGGKLGTVIRTPTRALTAADEFWKSLLNHAELRQIAYRTAHRQGGTPEEVEQRYQSLLRNPSDEMMQQAKVAARYWTFQQPLGDVGRAVQQISNKSVLGKIIMPFVRTPSNIIKFAGERSVFGPLAMPSVRQALMAGGRARDEALAKITLGSGLSAAAVFAALDGRLTGSGPTDPRERAALLQSGWQPNSIRIGNRYISYGRLDPIATLLGVAADFAEAAKWGRGKELDQIALNLAESIAKNITNKTWLSGLSDAFDVLSDPERYGKGYARRLIASATTPAILSQTAQAIDPNLHDARTIMDAIKARVPVISESVPLRRNVWGDPVTSGDAVGPDILSPFYATNISNDPVNREIARLRVPLAMPQRQLTIDGRRVQLDAKQYDELVQLSGKPAKQYLEQEMRSPEWRTLTDVDRVQFVKDTLADYRDAGRSALIELHPELGGQSAAPPKAAISGTPPLPPGFTLERPANDRGRALPGSLAPVRSGALASHPR